MSEQRRFDDESRLAGWLYVGAYAGYCMMCSFVTDKTLLPFKIKSLNFSVVAGRLIQLTLQGKRDILRILLIDNTFRLDRKGRHHTC